MNGLDEAVRAHLDTVASKTRRRDADTLLELMARITGEEPRMWGPSIIGFGSYHYKYASGREGDAPAAGFSPRKAATSVSIAISSSPCAPRGLPSCDRRRAQSKNSNRFRWAPTQSTACSPIRSMRVSRYRASRRCRSRPR